MKRKYLHIAMFRAMDCRYDELENPPEMLAVFLSDANTYIWADHKTADPAVQADFDKSMDSQNIGEEVDEDTAYNAVKNQVDIAVKNHKRKDKPLAIILDVDETVLTNLTPVPIKRSLILWGHT